MWELTAANHVTREKGLREAVNTMIQSPSADIVKLSMIDLKDLPLILQVHDELIYEMYDDSEKDRIERVCCAAYPLVPELKVKIKVGRNYAFD